MNDGADGRDWRGFARPDLPPVIRGGPRLVEWLRVGSSRSSDVMGTLNDLQAAELCCGFNPR